MILILLIKAMKWQEILYPFIRVIINNIKEISK